MNSGERVADRFRWLADQGQLTLIPRADNAAQQSGTQALLTQLLRGGYRIEVYSTFAMLSDLGFIVRTRQPPAPVADAPTTNTCHGTDKQSGRPIKRQRLETESTGPCASASVLVEGAKLCRHETAARHAPLGPQSIHLDVFAPDKTFRRSAVETPHYVISVCDVDFPPPNSTQLRQLAASEQGSTLLHAVASGAEVQLLSLTPRPGDEFDLRDAS